MKVNKLMAMALAMTMSFALCACGEKKQTEESIEEPVTEPVTEEITQPTEPPVPEKTVPEKILEKMSLKEKVCQMFITTPEQLSGYDIVTLYDDIVGDAIADYNIGGLIMFAENFETTEQTTDMINAIQECALANSGIGMFMSVDEEGGTVARVADTLGTTSFDDMAVYGEQNDTHVSYEIGYTIGTDLKALGFNLDFAPVADVNISDMNELGGRIFSSDPQVVADMATNVAVGLKDAGVMATMKHFPGLGAENGNTHTDSAVVVDRSVDDLYQTEFVPFRKGIESGVDFIMVGHQAVSGVGDWLPSDLSYTVVTEMLRNNLSFNGVIITDSHAMNTITENYTSAEASVMAVKAGVDMILIPENLAESVDAVCSAVQNGEIEQSRIDDSVLRILNKKYSLGLLKENNGVPTTEPTTDENPDAENPDETETETEITTDENGEIIEAPTESEEDMFDEDGNPITTTFAGYVAGTFVDPNAITTTTTSAYDYDYDYDYDYNYDYDYDYGYDDYYGW